MFTVESDTPWPFLADLVRYQQDFSATRENNRNLSITRGLLLVMEEVCGLGVVVGIQMDAIIMYRTTKFMI
jgi:hypothetical protein